MKSGELLLLGATLTFILSCVAGIFFALDNSTQTTGISGDLIDYSDETMSNTQNTEAELQTLVTSDTGFKVKENIYIDERGDSEASLTSESAKSSTTGFINSIKGNKFLGFLDVSIWVYIISIIILVGTILGLRMVIGNNRI